MHYMTKKALVKKYQPMITTHSEDDIKALMYGENLSVDDVSEIWEALNADQGDAGESSASTQIPPPEGIDKVKNPAPEKPISKNKIYAEHKVSPKYEDVTDPMGNVLGRKLAGFEKDSEKPIRKTSISPDRAEILNQQSENTLLRLYEVE